MSYFYVWGKYEFQVQGTTVVYRSDRCCLGFWAAWASCGVPILFSLQLKVLEVASCLYG
jgi:hypothetical protein